MKTLNDISKRTGYSVSTISRVLNGKSDSHRISRATREKVLQAVKELGYKPDVVAQSLRNKMTKTIGLVVPYIQNPYFANIASVVIREARKFGHTVIVIDSVDEVEHEHAALDSLLSRRIDGIIMIPCGEDCSRLEALGKDIPLVLVDRYFNNCELPYVASDNHIGAFQATIHLLEAGHRKILCIKGADRSITSRERVRGYIDALSSFGIEGMQMVRGNAFTISNGYVEAMMALSSENPPTAIFALSNTILLGTLQAINESGLTVPDDVSLVSFDDHSYLDYLKPAITRVAQPLENICTIAVKMLMEMILHKTAPECKDTLLHPKLIRRDSVRTLAANSEPKPANMIEHDEA